MHAKSGEHFRHEANAFVRTYSTPEFEVEELRADDVCARTIRKLRRLGVRRFYVSNLPVANAAARLQTITRLALAAEDECGG